MANYINTIDDLNDSKYKASTHQQLLLYLCIDGELEVVKWIYEEFVSNSIVEPTIIFDSNVLLCSVLSGNAELVRFILCINPEIMEKTVVAYSSESNMNLISISLFSSIKNGFIDVCEYLMGLKKEFGLNNEESEIQINVLSAAFISALKHGFIDICELIISVKPDVDVTLFNYRCFYSCCNEGHLEAAKWFYDKYPDVLDSIGFEIAFSYSSCRKHSELTKWLFTVKPELRMDII